MFALGAVACVVQEKAQGELEETVEMLRQMEIRASAAEEDAAGARSELAALEESSQRDSSALMENLSSLILSEDRSTWARSLLEAVGTVESRAVERSREERAAESESAHAHAEEAEAEAAKTSESLTEMQASLEEARRGLEASERAKGDLQSEMASLQESLDAFQQSSADLESQLSVQKQRHEEDLEARLSEQRQREAQEVLEWKQKHEELRTKTRALLEAKDKELQASKAMSRLEQSGPAAPLAPPAEEEAAAPATLPDVPLTPSGFGGQSSEGPATGKEAEYKERIAELEELSSKLAASLDDSERTHQLRTQSEQILKEEIREMQREEKRGNVDINYLKNVVIMGIRKGELSGELVTVLSRLLHFSPEDLAKIPKQKSLLENLQGRLSDGIAMYSPIKGAKK